MKGCYNKSVYIYVYNCINNIIIINEAVNVYNMYNVYVYIII